VEKFKPKIIRYKKILSQIQTRILTGVYKVGDNLPSEASFCAEFQASRFTIREALRILELDGVIKRKQGSCGTVIRKKNIETYIQNLESITDLVQFAKDTDYKIISSEKIQVSEKLASSIATKKNQIWTCQTGLRLEKKNLLPLALIETYISPSIEPFAKIIIQKKPPFFTDLEEKTGLIIDNIEQEIQALCMPDEITKHLNVPKLSISLRILRRYQSNNKTLLASFNWHLGGEKFIFSTYLKNKLIR